MQIKYYQVLSRGLCHVKGFSLEDSYLNRCEKVARLHSEISEYYDAVKHGESKERRAEELADVFLLVMNLLNIEGITNFDDAIIDKIWKNLLRPYKYGTVEEGRYEDASTRTDDTTNIPCSEEVCGENGVQPTKECEDTCPCPREKCHCVIRKSKEDVHSQEGQ